MHEALAVTSFDKCKEVRGEAPTLSQPQPLAVTFFSTSGWPWLHLPPEHVCDSHDLTYI